MPIMPSHSLTFLVSLPSHPLHSHGLSLDKPLPKTPTPSILAKDTPPQTPKFDVTPTIPLSSTTYNTPIIFTSAALNTAPLRSIFRILSLYGSSARGYGIGGILACPATVFAVEKIGVCIGQLEEVCSTPRKLIEGLDKAVLDKIPDDAKCEGWDGFFEDVLRILASDIGKRDEREEWMEEWRDGDFKKHFEKLSIVRNVEKREIESAETLKKY